MHPTIARALAATGAAAALTLGLAGCGSVAPEASVEEQIRDKLGTESADCPADLDGAVGGTLTCTATAGGESFDVTVTVTGVEGDTIDFDMERVGAPVEPVADTGAVAGGDVAQAVFDQLTAQVGQEPDEVSCPDLPATVGESVRCDLAAGVDTYGVTVTVTSVQGGDVNFDIQVDEAPS